MMEEDFVRLGEGERHALLTSAVGFQEDRLTKAYRVSDMARSVASLLEHFLAESMFESDLTDYDLDRLIDVLARVQREVEL